MAEKNDSRSASPTIEGIEQPNKNCSLGVGLRTETSGLEATLGNIYNMAKMPSLLTMMFSSRQQGTADFANSPPAKRKTLMNSRALTTIILHLTRGLRAIIQMMM